MNYLLDTLVFLWVVGDPGRLKTEAAAVIQNRQCAVFVSAVSAVEIAIKSALGKLQVPSDIEAEITLRGFSHLPLRYSHGKALEGLAPHHQDPFDRMLIAQAILEGLTLITHDQKFEHYPVEVLWT